MRWVPKPWRILAFALAFSGMQAPGRAADEGLPLPRQPEAVAPEPAALARCMERSILTLVPGASARRKTMLEEHWWDHSETKKEFEKHPWRVWFGKAPIPPDNPHTKLGGIFRPAGTGNKLMILRPIHFVVEGISRPITRRLKYFNREPYDFTPGQALSHQVVERPVHGITRAMAKRGSRIFDEGIHPAWWLRAIPGTIVTGEILKIVLGAMANDIEVKKEEVVTKVVNQIEVLMATDFRIRAARSEMEKEGMSPEEIDKNLIIYAASIMNYEVYMTTTAKNDPDEVVNKTSLEKSEALFRDLLSYKTGVRPGVCTTVPPTMRKPLSDKKVAELFNNAHYIYRQMTLVRDNTSIIQEVGLIQTLLPRYPALGNDLDAAAERLAGDEALRYQLAHELIEPLLPAKHANLAKDPEKRRALAEELANTIWGKNFENHPPIFPQVLIELSRPTAQREEPVLSTGELSYRLQQELHWQHKLMDWKTLGMEVRDPEGTGCSKDALTLDDFHQLIGSQLQEAAGRADPSR